jgi:hypothetical protein
MTEQTKQPDELDVQAKETVQYYIGHYQQLAREWAEDEERRSGGEVTVLYATAQAKRACYSNFVKTLQSIDKEIAALRDRAERAEVDRERLKAADGVADTIGNAIRLIGGTYSSHATDEDGYEQCYVFTTPHGDSVRLLSHHDAIIWIDGNSDALASLTAQVATANTKNKELDQRNDRLAAECRTHSKRWHTAESELELGKRYAESLQSQLLAANQRADEAEGERDTYKRGYEGREKAKQMWFEKKQMADKRVQELEQELARKTAAFESYGKTLMGDTGDLYTHIGHIIGKYSSDKNAVHDLQTIDNLLAALTADRDEWKEQHENLLEMYRQSQGQLSLAQTELEQVKEMHIDAEAARDDYANTINDLCNVAWQRVYGEGKTDWEYPAQAIRHLVQLCDEKDKEVEAVKGELERYRYHHELAEKARQNDACTECKGSGEIGYMTETELGPEGDSSVCHICAGSGSYRVAEVIASWGDTEEIADLRAKLLVAESSLAALQAQATTDRERAAEMAKAMFDELTAMPEGVSDEWKKAALYQDCGVLDMLVDRGYAEKHETKRWYRWVATAGERGRG